jgi:hypothetical protein
VQNECLWYTHSNRFYSKKYHFALMITENCKISTANIIRVDKNLLDSNIMQALKKNFPKQNEKCEFSFIVFSGFPEELQRLIEKCQNYLLSDTLKAISNIKNDNQIKFKTNRYSTKSLTNRFNPKHIPDSESEENESNQKTTTNIILTTSMSQININEEKLGILVKNSSLKLIGVQEDKNMTQLAKKCYNLRFSSGYKECLNIHYKCHFFANDREKLKECRLKNGIIGVNFK